MKKAQAKVGLEPVQREATTRLTSFQTSKPLSTAVAAEVRGVEEEAAAAGGGGCLECRGSGYVLDDQLIARPCRCGLHGQRALLRRLAEAGIPARFRTKSFESFQTAGNANLRQILEAARSYALGFQRDCATGLVMRGITGSGKSHLAVSILRQVIGRGFTGIFWNFNDLLTRLRESYRPDAALDESDLLDPMDRVDLLILDDLGAEMAKDWVRDRLYLIVNRRYEANRATIVTTNCDETELDNRIGPRTASRLYEMCSVTLPRFPEVDWRRAQMR